MLTDTQQTHRQNDYRTLRPTPRRGEGNNSYEKQLINITKPIE